MSGKLDRIEAKLNLVLKELGLVSEQPQQAQQKTNQTGTKRRTITADAVYLTFDTKEEHLFEVKVIPGGSINFNWPGNMDKLAAKEPFNIDLPTGKNGEDCQRFVAGPAGFRPALPSDEWYDRAKEG